MHTMEAGGINLTCSSLRKRKMLVRHSEGSSELTQAALQGLAQHHCLALSFPPSPAFPQVTPRDTKAVQTFNETAQGKELGEKDSLF